MPKKYATGVPWAPTPMEGLSITIVDSTLAELTEAEMRELTDACGVIWRIGATARLRVQKKVQIEREYVERHGTDINTPS